MSILTNPAQKIKSDLLKKHGFWKDGWGSLSTRKTKNTNMWTKVHNSLEIKWFPPYWEGCAYCNGIFLASELQRRCWITDKYNRNYISPVLKDFEELMMFIRHYDDYQFGWRSELP